MSESSSVASVVVPVFNNPDGLQTTLAALEAQTITTFEVIVVDDGSTEGLGAAEPVIDRHAGWRFVRTENRGAAAARNVGAEMATTDLILFADCRDEPAPEWVEAFTAACTPGVGIVRSGARYRYRTLNVERTDRPGRCVLPG